ncbi:hypothetical protein BpHYR1_019573 [Brachionus plicatilis]|uniref:Uncharacterized protein n=1 Tax=Brachionus plicatilis TaxID=10195 RepID=A0A3M7Q376_BRAPC|nr:hypothetical protein BpHYR1_019573 [Brachionus plicatilis]
MQFNCFDPYCETIFFVCFLQKKSFSFSTFPKNLNYDFKGDFPGRHLMSIGSKNREFSNDNLGEYFLYCYGASTTTKKKYDILVLLHQFNISFEFKKY